MCRHSAILGGLDQPHPIREPLWERHVFYCSIMVGPRRLAHFSADKGFCFYRRAMLHRARPSRPAGPAKLAWIVGVGGSHGSLRAPWRYEAELYTWEGRLSLSLGCCGVLRPVHNGKLRACKMLLPGILSVPIQNSATLFAQRRVCTTNAARANVARMNVAMNDPTRIIRDPLISVTRSFLSLISCYPYSPLISICISLLLLASIVPPLHRSSYSATSCQPLTNLASGLPSPYPLSYTEPS